MAFSNHRAIAPKRNMGAHEEMMTHAQPDSSPIFPTPVKSEPTAPLASFFRRSPSIASLNRGTGESAHAFRRLPSTSPTSSLDGSEAVNSSRRLKLRLIPRQTGKTASSSDVSDASQHGSSGASDTRSSPSSSSGSRLKLKLRDIQAALKKSPDAPNSFAFLASDSSFHRKRSSSQENCDDDSDTDSEIDIMPPSKKVAKPAKKRPTERASSRKAKKVKVIHDDSDFTDEAMCDSGDEGSSSTASHIKSPVISPDNKLILSSNVLKRSERMLDPRNPEHAKLIAAAPKAGSEYYDSDAEELPGKVKDTSKPHLFRNVKWGSLAIDYSDTSAFTTEPEFTQFVPGRYERLPNDTAYDQKHKLIIRLTDSQNRARIFTNPPPVDWNNQEAITALNKRTVQQIRRNTSVRFREVVEPYVEIERQWILAHLQDGKPTGGWKAFVDGFNREFEGKKVEGARGVRPARSHSSLTKEVERFGSVYAKGKVPKMGGKGKVVSRKVKSE